MSRPEIENTDPREGLVDDLVTMAPTIAGKGWVSRWVDPALPVSGLDRDHLEADEIERILLRLSVVLFASTIPRRLGGDATSVELAEDKRRCRRVGWALRQSLLQWTKRVELPEASDEIRQAGAQLDWQEFEELHLATLTTATKRAATWAALNGERKWGASIVTRLENERRWVMHSLR